jgi:hypothetical protein
MTLIKQLQIECTVCKTFETILETDEDFQKWLDAEDDSCPNCMKMVAEKI